MPVPNPPSPWGNDILLNNLLYTMRSPERHAEVVTLCKSLIESTKMDDVKYDALRILAETYKEMGEEMVQAAVKQLGISLDSAVKMAEILTSCYEAAGDTTKVELYKKMTQAAVESAKTLDSITN